MIDPIKIRERFPFFKNNLEVIYFDSAATSQKPDVVIEELNNFYTKFNSNSGRGSYKLSSHLSKQVEDVRSKVAKFIGSGEDEIIFTSGASEGFNKTIQALCFGYLKDGDEILYSPYDHKSFILPWFGMQKILKNFGVSIELIPYDVRMTGGADIEDIFSKVSSRTKVISITHIHNIFGSDADIHKLKDLREKGVLIFADVTQSVGHIEVNVNNLGVDILAFSGHKMFASHGVGVLYVNKNLHDKVSTTSFGGGDGIILDGDEVKINKFNRSFESGTLNYAGILSLGKAIDFISELGIENIHAHLIDLTQYLLGRLREIKGIEFSKGANFWKCHDGFGIVSFNLNGFSSADVGFVLGEKGFLVRAGSHCSSRVDEVSDWVRVSMHVYNTSEEVDGLVGVLGKV